MTPGHSLVRYDNPVLVSKTDTSAVQAQGKKGEKADGKKVAGKKLPPVDDKARAKTPTGTQTEDILNSILPPREWDEAGQLWVQKVSSTPATRLDVINLQVIKANGRNNSITFFKSDKPERLVSVLYAGSSMDSVLVSDA
jgi:Axonemal dynein light chain